MPDFNFFQKAGMKIFRLNLPYAAGGSSQLDDPENLGWTPLTAGKRDLPTATQDYMMNVAAYLYRRNAIAHRIIEIIKAFVVGEGIVIQAVDKDVDKIIQAFWHNRRNNWRKYLRDRVASLSLYGEALWPAYINDVDGSVIIGSNFPGIIKEILPNVRNNFEAEIVMTKEGTDVKGMPVESQALQVIKLDTDTDSPSYNLYRGDTFFFAINKPLESLRGISDLFSVADWLDIFDRFAFNRAERQAAMSTYLWDIKIEGASKDELDRRLTEIILSESKQRSGRLYVHNEKEERQAIAPDLQADDASRDAEIIARMIGGGTGLSSQAFGDPGGSGRQAGADVNEWVYKTLADRQHVWRDIIFEVLDFVIDQAILAGRLKKDVDRFIDIFMPKISMRDLQRLTQALRNLGTFVYQVSRAEGLLNLDDHDKKRLKQVMHNILDHIDQSSGTEMLHDIATGKEVVSPHNQSKNGSREVAVKDDAMRQ